MAPPSMGVSTSTGRPDLPTSTGRPDLLPGQIPQEHVSRSENIPVRLIAARRTLEGLVRVELLVQRATRATYHGRVGLVAYDDLAPGMELGLLETAA